MAVLETNRQCIRLLKQIADNLEAEKDSLMRIAIAKLEKLVEKEEKYGWHNLREQPFDLPEESGFYIACVEHPINHTRNTREISYYTDGVRGYDDRWMRNNRKVDVNSVVAWRKIKPYEEVK